MNFLEKLRAATRAFRRDRAGNFAMLSAIAAVPVVGAAGLAIDYATLSRTRVELQNALDAAVLAVAQRGTDISDAEAEAIAASFLRGNLAQDYRNMAVLRGGTSVTLKAQTHAPLAFAGLFGYGEAYVHASSTADIALISYEIALVLDTTGSMRGGKLQSMKDAVIGLIDDLSARVTNKERLKFALVPFATFVNVGAHFGPQIDEKGKIVEGTGAEWLDLKGNSTIPQLELKAGVSRFELFHHLGQEWKGCVETRTPAKGDAHDVDDTPAVKSDRASYFVPAFAIDEPDNPPYRRTWENDYIHGTGFSDVKPWENDLPSQARKLLKYGLLGAVEQILGDLKKLKIGGIGLKLGGGGLVPVETDYSGGKGPSRGCDMQPITPLSNDYSKLKQQVRSFVAAGNTNIMEGVAWGMRVLSPHEPFTEGEEAGPGLEKIMIVLTDGENNIGPRNNELGSSYSAFGYLLDERLGPWADVRWGSTQTMNGKTLEACANAKGEDGDEITVYTIRLEERDTATGTMLEACATSPGHYFDAPSREQLDDVFRSIRDGITKLRLSS